MTLTIPGLIVLIIIALFGPWLARMLNLGEPFVLRVNGFSFPILWSIIGGAIFVAILHLLAGPRRVWTQ